MSRTASSSSTKAAWSKRAKPVRETCDDSSIGDGCKKTVETRRVLARDDRDRGQQTKRVACHELEHRRGIERVDVQKECRFCFGSVPHQQASGLARPAHVLILGAALEVQSRERRTREKPGIDGKAGAQDSIVPSESIALVVIGLNDEAFAWGGGVVETEPELFVRAWVDGNAATRNREAAENALRCG